MSTQTAFVIACPMKLDQFKKVSQTIASHEKFLRIRITFQRYLFDEGNVLATFIVPRTIYMPLFF